MPDDRDKLTRRVTNCANTSTCSFNNLGEMQSNGGVLASMAAMTLALLGRNSDELTDRCKRR